MSTELPNDWHEVRARGRVVHLLACGGASYLELNRIAHGDLAVIVAAIAFESDDLADYSVMTCETVLYRLHGLLDELTFSPSDACGTNDEP